MRIDATPRASASRGTAAFAVYLVLFFAVWTAWVVWLYPRLQLLNNRSLAYAIANLSTRGLVWVAPVFLFVRYVDRQDPIAFLKLGGPWRKGVLIGALVGVLNLLG